MKTFIRKMVSLAFLVVLASLAAGLSSSAYAASSTTTKVPSVNCKHLLVHVQGTKSTSTCLDQVNKSNISPNTSVVGCDSNTLIIYADSNQSGWTICFQGSGSVNMTDYTGPAPYFWWNWNDQGSSYSTGCTTGVFYTDANQQGQAQGFGGNQSQNFDGQGFHLPNDTLSSIRIDYGC